MVAYIPNNYGLWLPSDTSLIVDPPADVVVQETKQGLALLLLESYNAAGD